MRLIRDASENTVQRGRAVMSVEAKSESLVLELAKDLKQNGWESGCTDCLTEIDYGWAVGFIIHNSDLDSFKASFKQAKVKIKSLGKG